MFFFLTSCLSKIKSISLGQVQVKSLVLPKFRLLLFLLYNRSDYYLAVNIYREPLGAGTIAKWLERFEIRNGFKHVSCHGLRHTYCSMLLSQNVPIQTVSKYMGHSDSTVTLKVYSHFIPDTQGIAVNALNRLTE